MKTRSRVVLLAALSVLGFGAGCASTKQAAHAFVPDKREGQVVSVQGNTIAVSDASKPSEPAAWFSISADTKLDKDGQRVELSQITEGMPVRVSFKPATGPEKATEVHVLTGAEAQRVQTRLQGQPDVTPAPPQENP